MRRDGARRAIRANPWLTGVLIASAVLFFFGVWRIDPYQTITDEAVSTALPFSIVQEPYGLTNFNKGGNFHIWLLTIAYLPVLALLGGYWLVTGQLTEMLDRTSQLGGHDSGSQWLTVSQEILEAYQLLVVTGRATTAAAGLLSVLGVALLARRIAGRPAGVVAAAALSVSLGFVLTAKFATEDVVLACLAVWTMLVLARYYDTGEDRLLALGAAMTGLAISTKATGGVLAFAVAALAFRRYEPSELLSRSAIRDVSRYPALAIATYVATTPSLLAYPDRYLQEILRYFTKKSGGGTFYAAPEPGWIAHLGHLVTALGVPLLALAIAATVGVAALAATGRISGFAWYPLGFAVAFYLIDSVTSSTQYNRILLIVPFLALFVGIVAAWAIDAERPREFRTVAGVLIAGVLVISLFYTASGAAVWSTSRAEATAWTHDNFDESTDVTILGHPEYLPAFPDGTNVTHASIDPLFEGQTEARKERVLRRVRCHRTDYLVLTSFHYERYVEAPSISPNRTAFYRSLLGGDAGYRTVTDFGPADPNLRRDAESNFERALRLKPPSRNANNPRIVVMAPTVPPGEGADCPETAGN